MIRILIFLLFNFTIASQAFSGVKKPTCSIEAFDQIYYLEQSNLNVLKKVIKKTNCSKKIVNHFINLIGNSKGTFNQHQLNNHFQKDSPIKIRLIPKKIQIARISDYLRINAKVKRDSKWIDVKLLNGKKIITLNKEQFLSMKCINCKTGGIKNIFLTSSDDSGNKIGKVWVTGKLLFKTKILTSRNDSQVNHSPLNLSQFEEKEMYVEYPEKYFNNSKIINYYKLNRNITKGQGLQFNNLTPLYLVRSGSLTKVIFKSKRLRIETMGLPLKNGKIGELIQLKNPQSKKVILGKVIGFNKVITNL